MVEENEELRARIIEGAGELFQRYGVRSVSMDDIARHLTMSKKTIYQFFKDKDEVVMMALKSHMEYEKQEYGQIFNSDHNAIEELQLVTKCMRKDFKDMNPALLFDLQKYHPNAWKIWLEFKNEYIKKQVESNLKKGIEEGYYRKEINPEVLARLRVEQVQLAFDENVYPSDKYNLTELQLLLFDHFVHGLVTEKGKQMLKKYFTKDNQLNNNVE